MHLGKKAYIKNKNKKKPRNIEKTTPRYAEGLASRFILFSTFLSAYFKHADTAEYHI